MCDYSLHHVASVPAKVGDKLVSSEFAMSSTRGFCAVGDLEVAVCLQPGTELAFDRDVLCERAISLLPRRRIAARVARFRQVNMDQPHTHHDALEFPDGRVVMVTDLAPGQMATVLQLPASAQAGEHEHPHAHDHEHAPAPTQRSALALDPFWV